MTDDYKIGYGRPPKANQFKKGQSGNKSGRPKGSQNLKSIVETEANAKVHIREGGESKTVTRAEALVKSTFNKAIQGAANATVISIGLMEKYLPHPDTEGPNTAPLTDEELSILQNHVDLQAAIDGASDDENDEFN